MILEIHNFVKVVDFQHLVDHVTGVAYWNTTLLDLVCIQAHPDSKHVNLAGTFG